MVYYVGASLGLQAGSRWRRSAWWPTELRPGDRRALVRDAQRALVDRGMVADIAFHGGQSENPHAHIMLTTRTLTPEGFGPKKRDWNQRELGDLAPSLGQSMRTAPLSGCGRSTGSSARTRPRRTRRAPWTPSARSSPSTASVDTA